MLNYLGFSLFGQGGPRGRAVMGSCRSSMKWFLPLRRLGCHESTPQGAFGCRPSSPSGDLAAALAATPPMLFPDKLWDKTSPLSAAQAKHLGPPALPLVSLLELCEHRLEEKPPLGATTSAPEHG